MGNWLWKIIETITLETYVVYIYIEKNIYIYIYIYIIDHIHKYRKKQHTHLTIKLKIIAYYSDLIGKMMIKHWLTIGFRGRLFSSPPPVASSWRAPCAPEPERLGQARRKVWSRAEENREKMGRIGVHIWFAQIKIISSSSSWGLVALWWFRFAHDISL